jgi:hypothetical protein
MRLEVPSWTPVAAVVSLDLQGDIVAVTVRTGHVELQQHNQIRRHHGSEL